MIYLEGKFIKKDLNKGFYYITKAANQNHSNAQLALGLNYLVKNEINKGLNYFFLSIDNGNIHANFNLGFVYHEGKYVKQDIQKAIHYYKESSSFNNCLAKNNLGIIYKNGFYDQISPNYSLAIEYFKEAIHNDCFIANYNLSHMYLYNEQCKDIDKAIDILYSSFFIKSFEINNEVSFKAIRGLLCVALVQKHGYNLTNIRKEIDQLRQKKIQKILQIFLLTIYLVYSFIMEMLTFSKNYMSILRILIIYAIIHYLLFHHLI